MSVATTIGAYGLECPQSILIDAVNELFDRSPLLPGEFVHTTFDHNGKPYAVLLARSLNGSLSAVVDEPGHVAKFAEALKCSQ